MKRLLRMEAFDVWFAAIVLVSFATTMHGIMAVIGSNSWTTWAIAATVSLVFQLTIVVGWRSAAKALGNRMIIAALGFALLGGGASTGSAIFSSSTNVELFNTEFLNRQQAVENRDVLIRPAVQMAKFTSELSQMLDEYAQVAGQRARIEADTGSSCEGPPKPPKCGSLCNLREQQKRDASEQAKLSRELREKAVKLQAGAVDVRTQEQVNTLFVDVSKLMDSSEISSIRAWATKEDNGFKTGFPVAGKILQCTDKMASAMVDAIKTHASKKIDVPASPPLVKVQGLGDAATRNIHALLEFLPTVVFHPSAVESMLADPTVSPFVAPWAIAFGIELICAVLAFREGWAKRGHFGDPLGRPLDHAAKARMQSVLKIIRNLSVHTYVGKKRRTWLVVPAGASTGSMEIENLPHLFKLKQPNMRGVIAIDRISDDEAVRSRIREAAGGAQYFTVWEFKDYEDTVAKIARQLGLEPNGPGGGSTVKTAGLRLVQ